MAFRVNSHSNIPTPLEVIAGSKTTLERIRMAVVSGEQDAWDNMQPDNLRYQRGSEAFFKRDEQLRQGLGSLEWAWGDKHGQRRFFSPPDYPYPIRLLHKRGAVAGNTMIVKGVKSMMRSLIHENKRLNETQMPLPGMENEHDGQDVPSVWVLAAASRTHLAVCLAHPVDFGDRLGELICLNTLPYEIHEFGEARIILNERPFGNDDDDEFSSFGERAPTS